MVAPPRPIVDADHRRRCKARAAAPAHHAQQGVVAGRDHETASEVRGGSPAQSQAEMMHEIVQTCRAPAPRRQDPGSKALGEDAAPAEHRVAIEPSRQQHELDRPTRPGQIGEAASIPAMDPFRRRLTAWTWAGLTRRAHDHHQGLTGLVDPVHHQAWRYKRRRTEHLAHGVISFAKTTSANRCIPSKLSQSQLWTPFDSQVAGQLGVPPGEAAGHVAQFLPQIMDHLSPNGQAPVDGGGGELQGLLARFGI